MVIHVEIRNGSFHVSPSGVGVGPMPMINGVAVGSQTPRSHQPGHIVGAGVGVSLRGSGGDIVIQGVGVNA